MNYIQDGAYDAKLLSAHYGRSKTNKPIVEFLWLIENSDLTIKSYLHLEMNNGLRNVKGVKAVQFWAVDWDGNDPEWFQEHLDICTKYKVRLTVVNEVSPTDPTRSFSHVKWVNPRRWARSEESRVKSEECGERKKPMREFERALFAELPTGIKPTMRGAWAAFSFLTQEWTSGERERKWFSLIGKVAPGKDQIDFTPEDWQGVIDEMKKGTEE